MYNLKLLQINKRNLDRIKVHETETKPNETEVDIHIRHNSFPDIFTFRGSL